LSETAGAAGGSKTTTPSCSVSRHQSSNDAAARACGFVLVYRQIDGILHENSNKTGTRHYNFALAQ